MTFAGNSEGFTSFDTSRSNETNDGGNKDDDGIGPTGSGKDESESENRISVTEDGTDNGIPEPPTVFPEGDLRETESCPEEPAHNDHGTTPSSEWENPLSSSENGSGDGGGGGDRGVVTRFFGVRGYGTKFVWVIDRSGSMYGSKLSQVIKEVLQSLSDLNDKCQFNIIIYDDRFDVWRPGGKLMTADTANRKDAERFVQDITSRGGTEHRLPLLEAIKYKPEVIFFLTDGQSLKQTELEEICHASGNISINVIQFDDGYDGRSEILRQLALRNKGQYKYINVATSDAL